jgi:hypothetical protein
MCHPSIRAHFLTAGVLNQVTSNVNTPHIIFPLAFSIQLFSSPAVVHHLRDPQLHLSFSRQVTPLLAAARLQVKIPLQITLLSHPFLSEDSLAFRYPLSWRTRLQGLCEPVAPLLSLTLG